MKALREKDLLNRHPVIWEPQLVGGHRIQIYELTRVVENVI